MRARNQRGDVVDSIDGAKTRQQDAGIVRARAPQIVGCARGRVFGVTGPRLETSPALLDVLVTQAGRECEAAELQAVLHVQRHSPRALDAIASIAVQARIVQVQPPPALAVGTVALETVFLVFVQASPHFHRVRDHAAAHIPGHRGLHAAREVRPVVGADLDAPRGRIQSAVEDVLELSGGQGAQAHAAIDGLHDASPTGPAERLGVEAAVGVESFGLEPIARVSVVVAREGELHGRRWRVLVARDGLLVVGFDSVPSGEAVASRRVAPKIVVGESEVTLVGLLRGGLQLQLERVCAAWGIGDFEHRVANVQAGVVVAPIHTLETIGSPLMTLREEPEAVVGGCTVRRMHPVGRVLSGLGEYAPATACRNWRGDHVERATDGVRSLDDGGRTLKDLERRHATGRREVVGRRSGVGCRRDQYAVFEQSDPSAPFGGHTADTDIRPQPEAILHLDRHARYLAYDTLHVRVRESVDLLGTDEVC